MATDGGVIIYGVGEDAGGRPTRLTPVGLAGARERIDAIVQSSIQPVPAIRITSFPLLDDASRGYIVVLVPSSPLAPHQISAAGKYQHRFYGRGPTGNRPLAEPEVARLYERRSRSSVDRRQHLLEVIEEAPFRPRADLGYLHAFARPVVPDDDRWTTAAGGNDRELGQRLLAAVRTASGLASSYQPMLAEAPGWIRSGADSWVLAREDSGDAEYGHATTPCMRH